MGSLRPAECSLRNSPLSVVGGDLTIPSCGTQSKFEGIALAALVNVSTTLVGLGVGLGEVNAQPMVMGP